MSSLDTFVMEQNLKIMQSTWAYQNLRYPCSIITRNLDHETFVDPDKYKDLSEYKTHIINLPNGKTANYHEKIDCQFNNKIK